MRNRRLALLGKCRISAIFFASLIAIASAITSAEAVEKPSRNSIVAQVYAQPNRFIEKTGVDSAPKEIRRALILESDLDKELERQSPGVIEFFQEQIQKNGALTQDQKSIFKGKKERAILEMSMGWVLDQEARSHGLSLVPSESRLNYALRTVLLQFAIEGVSQLPVAKAVRLSNAELFSEMKKSELQLQSKVQSKGETYIELHLDQDWRYPNLGQFREVEPPLNAKSWIWPVLTFKFSCALQANGGIWSFCFGKSIDDLRNELKVQLQSAIRKNARRTVISNYLHQMFPDLNLRVQLVSDDELKKKYDELKNQFFRRRFVQSTVVEIKWDPQVLSGGSKFDESRVLLEFSEALGIVSSDKHRQGVAEISDSDLVREAIELVGNKLDLALSARDYHFNGALGSSKGGMHGFAISDLSLTCLGRFGSLPCRKNADGSFWVLMKRSVRTSDSFLSMTHPWVKEKIRQLIRVQRNKSAQLEVVKKLLNGIYFQNPSSAGSASAGRRFQDQELPSDFDLDYVVESLPIH